MSLSAVQPRFLFCPTVRTSFVSSCPPGRPRVHCYRNPCSGETCPWFPRARCVPNYCGGCHAEFYVGHRRVQCRGVCTVVALVTVKVNYHGAGACSDTPPPCWASGYHNPVGSRIATAPLPWLLPQQKLQSEVADIKESSVGGLYLAVIVAVTVNATVTATDATVTASDWDWDCECDEEWESVAETTTGSSIDPASVSRAPPPPSA